MSTPGIQADLSVRNMGDGAIFTPLAGDKWLTIKPLHIYLYFDALQLGYDSRRTSF